MLIDPPDPGLSFFEEKRFEEIARVQIAAEDMIFVLHSIRCGCFHM